MHDQLRCTKCSKRCDYQSKNVSCDIYSHKTYCDDSSCTIQYHACEKKHPVEPKNENPSPTGDLSPVQPTPEETRQTGSEVWEKKFDELYIAKTYLTGSERSAIKQFIRDLLAAQRDGQSNGEEWKGDNSIGITWQELKDHHKKQLEEQREEMEKRNMQLEMERDAYKKRAEAQEEKNFILKSEVARTEKEIVVDSDINSDPFFDRVNKKLKEDHNKQIIEAVELYSKIMNLWMLRELFINIDHPEYTSADRDKAVEILNKVSEKALADFKREYGDGK